MTAGHAETVINDCLAQGHRLTHILEAIQMPQSTYYYWKYHVTTNREQENINLKRKILTIWHQSHHIYGYPRIHTFLKRIGIHVSSRRVWKIMNKLGIHSIMNKKYRKPHTNNDYAQRPNLVKGDWHNVWSSDITYIQLNNHRWVYLASVYDPIHHKVIAHKVNNTMSAELVTGVMQRALKTSSCPNILHSDMGSQYTSDFFEQCLFKHGIKHSYSLKGYPYDNAYIENFHSMLKRELVFHQQYSTISEVIANIDWYVRWYNNQRISLIA